MELPLYQKHLIEAMRSGCKIWKDVFGRTTYHIKIGRSIKNITEPTILALISHGLLTENDNYVVLSDNGINCKLQSNSKERKTLYKI